MAVTKMGGHWKIVMMSTCNNTHNGPFLVSALIPWLILALHTVPTGVLFVYMYRFEIVHWNCENLLLGDTSIIAWGCERHAIDTSCMWVWSPNWFTMVRGSNARGWAHAGRNHYWGPVSSLLGAQWVLYHYFDNSNTVLPMATTSPADPSIHNLTFHPSSLNCDLNTWHLMESRVAVCSTHHTIQPPCLLISISMLLYLSIMVAMAMLLVALLRKNIQMTRRGIGMNL